MSERTVAGLDTMSAEDNALMASMRDEAPAPELEAAPEAAAPEPEHKEAQEAADPTRTVPHQALHAEREKRKAAEAKAAAAEQKAAVEAAKFAERFQMLAAAVQAQATPAAVEAPAAVEIPDVNTDPIGHFKALYEHTQKAVQEQSAILNGFQQQQKQAREVNELRAWGTQQEQAFMAQEPSYVAAMDHLRQSRHAELEAVGITDPAQREALIMQDVTQIAQAARQQGVNYAERLYNVALKRGFQKATETPAIPALDAAPPALDAIQRAQRGRDSATTISAAGTAAPVALSPERIASMSDAQFSAYISKIKGDPAALRNLMGA